MFVDEAEIILEGGHGGSGKVSFGPGKKSGPDGGDGGQGGSVYIKTTPDLTALRRFTHTKTLKAENGEPGGNNQRHGKDGKDIEVILPAGSILEEITIGKSYELITPNQIVLIAKGGRGGKGNAQFKSPTNTTPKYAQPGLPGERKHFKIHLKLIADFGLIGLPNAGKSSLLNEITNTQVKVANYPFTTLEPNLGILKNGKIIADIPGLIKGASKGRGLGFKFLKHIEKTNILLHCISVESDDLKRDYQVVREELKNYNPILLEKPEIILLTKSDLVTEEELKKKLKTSKQFSKVTIPVSIHDWDSLEELKQLLQKGL